jgi:hypothetical protein
MVMYSTMVMVFSFLLSAHCLEHADGDGYTTIEYGVVDLVGMTTQDTNALIESDDVMCHIMDDSLNEELSGAYGTWHGVSLLDDEEGCEDDQDSATE